MLLKDEHRQREENSNKTLNTIALTHCNFDY